MRLSGLSLRHQVDHHRRGRSAGVVSPAMEHTGGFEDRISGTALDRAWSRSVIADLDQGSTDQIGHTWALLMLMPGHRSTWGDRDASAAQHPTLQCREFPGEIQTAQRFHAHSAGDRRCVRRSCALFAGGRHGLRRVIPVCQRRWARQQQAGTTDQRQNRSSHGRTGIGHYCSNHYQNSA